MKALLFFVAIILIIMPAYSQKMDTTKLFNEADQVLKLKTQTGNQVLIRTRFLPLHEFLPFHELIQKFSEKDSVIMNWEGLAGISFHVKLTFLKADGSPLVNEEIYLFHTDSRGYYLTDTTFNPTRQPGENRARIFGYAKTDGKGQIFVETIRPGNYPFTILGVIPAPHIHIRLYPDGKAHYLTIHLVDNPEFGTNSPFQKKMREVGSTLDGKWSKDANINEPETADILANPQQQKDYQYLELTIKMD
jgi:protocatechuate 3,4-dioxygenase beta subunit